MTSTLSGRVVAALTLVAVSGAAGLGTAGRATAASATPPTASTLVRRCAAAEPGHRACMVVSRGAGSAPTPASFRQPGARSAGPAGLWPQDIRAAYNLGNVAATIGTDKTVAVIEALDNPHLEADLASYRTAFGMPPCTTADGCFTKYDEDGRSGSAATFVPAGRTGWGLEADLDVQAVSAACPRCHIMVVEGRSSLDADLIPAITAAAFKGATEMSLSFSGCEGSGDQLTTFDGALSRAGVPITAASGDSGYYSADNPARPAACALGSPGYPASSQYTTAVGGTTLTPSAGPRGWSETAWSYSMASGVPWGGGSGCSTDEPKPAWQHDGACARRMVADVAAVADPNTGLAVYDSYDDAGWDIVGGTSLSSPLVAAIDALKGNTGTGAQPWYSAVPPVNDVTAGSTAPSPLDCTGVQAYFCNATTGYDGPTGVGSPGGVTAPPRAPAWNGAASLGDGPLGADPQPVSPTPGAIDTFWRAADGTLAVAEYAGGAWHGSIDLGGSSGGALATSPHPVATGGGTVDVFWRGADGALWHVYEVGGGPWSVPASLGGGPLGTSDPQPTSSGHGDVAVFWRGTDANLWEAAYRPDTGWRVPIGLGCGPLNGTPHAAAYTTDSYDVFWRGTDSGIWHTYGGAPGFTGPQTIGMGPVGGDPVAIEASSFAVNLFWQGADGGLWHAWYAAGWRGPQGLGGSVVSQPAPVVASPALVDAFWRGSDGDVWHLVEGSPSELYETNLATGAVPAAFSWGGGHEEVFWQGSDSNLWHDWTS